MSFDVLKALCGVVGAMAVVLIVEDEEQVRLLAESYLQEQGHQTVSAATAEEALAALEATERVDLLFTDIGWRSRRWSAGPVSRFYIRPAKA